LEGLPLLYWVCLDGIGRLGFGKVGLWYIGLLSGWVWQVGVREGWALVYWGFVRMGFGKLRVWKVLGWWIGLGKVGFGKVGFGKVGFGRLGFERLGFGLCSLEGGEGGVLGRSGLVAGGGPHGDGHKAGCGGGGPGPLLYSLRGGGGRRVQAPPGLQRLRHLGGE
jgi:hypothetical protein